MPATPRSALVPPVHDPAGLADGPLDPERKRMFMAMKREVLRLGGYQREFFVSQTPELTAMADAVIDMDLHKEEHEVPTGA